MDILSWLLARKYTDNSILGIAGALAGKNCTIESANKVGSDTTIVFKWTADNGTVRRTSIVVTDGDTPAISVIPIAMGHRITFTTSNPAQSVTFDINNGNDGAQGISVVGADVDNNNYLKLTLSNGNVINAGQIKAVTNVDPTLSPTSSNPVENKVITAALDTKVDKETGKGLFSDTEKNKLAHIEDNAQVNVLEKLIINGQEATITDKSIALTIITSAVSNLQNYYLKSETYTKQEVEDLIGSTVGVTIEIVEQLPTEGQSNVIYFLPTESEGVYSQYIYTTDGWILIGSTTVDLSNYYTKAQVDALLNGKQNVLTIDAFPTALSNNPVASGGVYSAIASMQPQFQFANMPVPSATNLGFVYQYIGTAGTYEPNMFYRCVYKEDIGEYQWVEVIFHATVTVDSELSSTSTNPVQNKVIKEALDKKQNVMQYSILPSAQDNLGAIVQYMGATTSDYTNGFFYKSIYDTESASYIWVLVEFAANITVDSALSTTSENPVQNQAITNKIGEIEDLIPSEASSTNQLVDRDSLGTASQKNFTPYVSPNDGGVPISSSVYSAITSAVYGIYNPTGSKTCAELTSDLLIQANVGNVYKITDDGVTTSLFVGGAGQPIVAGDDAIVVYGGTPNTFLYDLRKGDMDLTGFQREELAQPIQVADSEETTVEGALGALSDNKASKVSNATAGDIATLDANGNLVDSGKTISDVVPLIRIDTTSDSATHGYYKIFDGSTVTASTREVYITGTLHNDSSTPIESSHTQVDLSVRMNKDGASFNGFVSNLPNGFDIVAVGNGTNAYGIYIKAQGAWLKARLKLTANIVGSSSEIITNPTCVASISESVQTNYSDSWHKVVTNEIVPSDASASNKLVSVNGKIRGLNTGNWISTSFDDAVPSDNSSMQIFTVLNSATRTPATGPNYLVITQAFDTNNIQQEAIQNVTNNRYIRYYDGSSWSSWEKLVTESDLKNTYPLTRVDDHTCTFDLSVLPSTENGLCLITLVGGYNLQSSVVCSIGYYNNEWRVDGLTTLVNASNVGTVTASVSGSTLTVSNTGINYNGRLSIRVGQLFNV